MAQYSVESFKNCLFNPLVKDILKKYPELQEVSKSDKVLRYILSLYDPNSPLIRDCRNIKTRKQEAARLAGFDLVKDSEFLEDLYACRDKEAVTGTIYFLREHVHNMLWTMIVSHEQTFYEYNERLLKPVDDETSRISVDEDGQSRETTTDVKEKDLMATVTMKSKLIKDCKEIYTLLQEYYKEMFPDEELRSKVSTRITPETMARA